MFCTSTGYHLVLADITMNRHLSHIIGPYITCTLKFSLVQALETSGSCTFKASRWQPDVHNRH